MRAALAAVALALLAGTAFGEAETLSVTSATGGIRRPGRFSPVLVRLRADAGRHEVRARLAPGQEVVVGVTSAGGEETVLLPLLPETDADGIEIDVGSGWQRHPLLLRPPAEERPVVGVAAGIRDDPAVAALRTAHGWLEVTLPEGGGSAALRDVCDLVIDRLPVSEKRVTRILDERGKGPRTAGPEVTRWLLTRAAGAAVAPSRVRAVLPVLILATGLVLGLVAFSRRRGWGGFRTVGAAAGLAAMLLLAWAFPAGRASSGLPRAAARGVAIVRHDGGRIDLLVVSGRGRTTCDLATPVGTLLRPLPGPTGRTGTYRLRDGRILEGLALGEGRRAFVRIDRDAVPGASVGPPAVAEVVHAFSALGDEAVWIGRWTGGVLPGSPREPLAAIWDRFREDRATRPLSARGRLLRKIARPALRPGVYGFLPQAPRLDAEAMGVETAEILHAIVVP